jgi:hypothetical protein
VVYSLFSYHQKNLGDPGSSKGKLERIRAGLTLYLEREADQCFGVCIAELYLGRPLQLRVLFPSSPPHPPRPHREGSNRRGKSGTLPFFLSALRWQTRELASTDSENYPANGSDLSERELCKSVFLVNICPASVNLSVYIVFHLQ